jgi:sn-glycerol 3-phosphate transport system ATP-binding protein
MYGRPATSFAAGFIGTPPMNLLALADGPAGAIVRGTATEAGGGDAGAALFAGRGEGLLLGLRPELVRLGTEGRFAATVRSIDYHGADSIIECAIGDQVLVVRTEGVSHLVPGAPVRLSWSDEAMHIFDAASGRRVDSPPAPGDSRDRRLHAVT